MPPLRYHLLRYHFRSLISRLLLLIPFLGFALLAFGMQMQHGPACRSAPGMAALGVSALEIPDSPCQRRASQRRAVAAARRNMCYWQRRTCGPGPVRACDRARRCRWERGYRQRRDLYVRLYGAAPGTL